LVAELVQVWGAVSRLPGVGAVDVFAKALDLLELRPYEQAPQAKLTLGQNAAEALTHTVLLLLLLTHRHAPARCPASARRPLSPPRSGAAGPCPCV